MMHGFDMDGHAAIGFRGLVLVVCMIFFSRTQALGPHAERYRILPRSHTLVDGALI